MGDSEKGEHRHVGSFAEGAETTPHAAEEGGPGSFNEGQGMRPTGGPGHFSEGQEGMHVDDERMGSFADTSDGKKA